MRLPALRERSDLMTLVHRILDRENPNRRLRPSADVVKLLSLARQRAPAVQRVAHGLGDGRGRAQVTARERLSDDF